MPIQAWEDFAKSEGDEDLLVGVFGIRARTEDEKSEISGSDLSPFVQSYLTMSRYFDDAVPFRSVNPVPGILVRNKFDVFGEDIERVRSVKED